MKQSNPYLNPSEAARKLGLSPKTLRIYEARGLIVPPRTAAGWRAYGPDDMARAAEIATLRRLGLSLAQVSRVLDGSAADLDAALAAHAKALERQKRDLDEKRAHVRRLRAELASGAAARTGDVLQVLEPARVPSVAFALPWPWGGERFELGDIRPVMYITGPLGSGKTRLAQRLAEELPDAAFLGLDRLDDSQTVMDGEPIDGALAWIMDEGGTECWALRILLAALEVEGHGILVVDLIEQGLDAATQSALAAYMRHRMPPGAPLFALTRSTAILDLDLVGPDSGILYCPANHSPPLRVAPVAGAAGHEAVATCLAPPDVRARTEGVIAWRSQAV